MKMTKDPGFLKCVDIINDHIPAFWLTQATYFWRGEEILGIELRA
jgi:hypothetical protein